MEIVSVSISNRIHQLLQAHSIAHHVSVSAVVETALDDFLTLVERCDPEAREVARKLSLTDE